MALLPHLPILPRESLISYISRIARYHGNTSTFDFLNVIEMSRHSVLCADPEALIRLASMTGNTLERLLDSTWSSLGVRLHEHRGVVSRMLWKFRGGVLRACEGASDQAARSSAIGSMG